MAAAPGAHPGGKRDGNVQIDYWTSEEALGTLDAMVRRLNEMGAAGGFKFERKNAAAYLYGLVQFMEDALGANSPYKPQPKLPAKVFRDLTPDGAASRIVVLCGAAAQARGQKRLDWANPGLRKDNLDLLARIRADLVRSGVLAPLRVAVAPPSTAAPADAASKARELRSAAEVACAKLGGELLEPERGFQGADVVVHLAAEAGPLGAGDALPLGAHSSGQPGGDGGEARAAAAGPGGAAAPLAPHPGYAAALPPPAPTVVLTRGVSALVHRARLPESYDEWVHVSQAQGLGTPAAAPAGGKPRHVSQLFLGDSTKYNEWMVAADYSLVEGTYDEDAGAGTAEAGAAAVGAAIKRPHEAGPGDGVDGAAGGTGAGPEAPEGAKRARPDGSSESAAALAPPSGTGEVADGPGRAAGDGAVERVVLWPAAEALEPKAVLDVSLGQRPEDGAVVKVEGPREGEAEARDAAPAPAAGPEGAAEARARLHALHRVPACAAWFRWERAAEPELDAFPEFFPLGDAWDGAGALVDESRGVGRPLGPLPPPASVPPQASRLARRYLEIRNGVIDAYREDPRRLLTFTAARRRVAADVGSVRRVYDFLHAWGLINASVSGAAPPAPSAAGATPAAAATRPPAAAAAAAAAAVAAGAAAVPGGSHSAAPPGADAVLRLPVSASAAEGADAALGGPPSRALASSDDPSGGGLAPPGRAGAGLASTAPRPAPASASGVRYFCNVMPWVDCTALRYHCTRLPDVDLCPQAYSEGRFPAGTSRLDFVRLEADEAPPDALGWSDVELGLLLEGVDLHGENWAKVAEHVGSHGPLQCALRFVQLPLQDGEGPGASGGPEGVLRSLGKTSGTAAVAAAAAASSVGGPEPSGGAGPPSPFPPGTAAAAAAALALAPGPDSVELPPRDAAASATSAAASLPPLLPFADANNPVLAQLAFLASAVGPRVAAAAAQRALEVLAEEDARLRAEAEAEAVPEREDGASAEADAAEAGRDAAGDAVPKDKRGEHPQLTNASLRAAAAAALGAAAVKAKLLADAEERELQRLVLSALDAQCRKVQAKLGALEALDEALANEKAELEKLRFNLLAGRMASQAAQTAAASDGAGGGAVAGAPSPAVVAAAVAANGLPGAAAGLGPLPIGVGTLAPGGIDGFAPLPPASTAAASQEASQIRGSAVGVAVPQPLTSA